MFYSIDSNIFGMIICIAIFVTQFFGGMMNLKRGYSMSMMDRRKQLSDGQHKFRNYFRIIIGVYALMLLLTALF